ncbi:MAG: hypothetical protein AB1765_04045 [Candidatus Hydrogenedentota bacterium]
MLQQNITGSDFNLDSISIIKVGDKNVNIKPEKFLKVSKDDKGGDILAKFPRRDIQKIIDSLNIKIGNIKEVIPITASGRLNSGIKFEGTVQAKVINPGDIHLLNKKK